MSLDQSFYSESSDDSTSSSEESKTETYEIEPRQVRPGPSTSGDDNGDDGVENGKKSRGKNKVYDMVVDQLTLNEAIDFVKTFDSTKWTRADTRKTQEGEKRFYTCQKGCQKRIFILLNAENEYASVYASDNAHQHAKNKTNTTLPNDTRDKVYELLEIGMTKNRHILREIERNNLTIIT